MKYFIKSNKYEKVSVNSTMYINCRSRPIYSYNLKGIELWYNKKYDIGDDNLCITKFSTGAHPGDTRRLDIDHENKGIVLLPDFSNIYYVYERIEMFLMNIFVTLKIRYGEFNPCSMFNYWSLSEANKYDSGGISVYVKSDFEDIENLDMYDFEYKRNDQGDERRIIFDGDTFKSNNFLLRFIRKPKIKTFDIELDSRINYVLYEFYYSSNSEIFFFLKNEEKGNYNLHFAPKTLEDFNFLRLLSNIDWKSDREICYKREDIIQLIYNV